MDDTAAVIEVSHLFGLRVGRLLLTYPSIARPTLDDALAVPDSGLCV